MQENTLIFPHEIYSAHLTTINGIALSNREIDILACTLNGRTAKETARLLSIVQKTVETHIYNVKKKFECSSLLSFIEESGKQTILHRYYFSLLINTTFEKILADIAKKSTEKISCLIVSRPKENLSFLSQFKAHLALAGVKTRFDVHEHQKPLSQLIQEMHTESYTLYILSRRLIPDDEMKRIFSKESFSNILFLKTENHVELCDGVIECSDFSKMSNYYFSFFDLLQKFFPQYNFDIPIVEFRKKYEGAISLPTIHSPPINPGAKYFLLSYLKMTFLQQKRFVFLSLFFVVLSATLFGFYGAKKNKVPALREPFFEQSDEALARSDLVLPIESVFLNRSELITKIDKKLRNQQGIQAIALVGMGGVGKTTLARQYGQQQKAKIIWELNAETQESLAKGFYALACAITKTAEDQKILKSLQDIKDSTEREERILQFVKNHLRASSHWFLIYDNVEKFLDIQKYFPQDITTWGKGTTILTTRDSNIGNNQYIKSMLPVGELSSQQKLNLFSKIMNDGIINFLAFYGEEDTKNFLEKIPSFPLDISVAAHYLKVTKVSYKEYLENLEKSDKDFSDTQETLLRETGDYLKTRYNIITLSLNHLSKAHKDFGELLLFISLLDSQNIPRDLLKEIKPSTVIDNFICHLNKYSLITQNSYSMRTLSIHRSMKAIALTHLIKELNLEKNKILIKLLSSALEKYMNNAVNNEDFIKMRPLVTHAKVFLSHNNLLDEVMKGSIIGSLGCIYLPLGNYKKAAELLNESINNLKKHEGGTSVKMAQFLACLGATYLMLGDHEKASHSFEEAIAIFNKFPSEANLIVARILTNLGNVYRDMGNYKKALSLLEKSLAIYQKLLPENHQQIGAALVILGNVYRALGNHTKAISLLEKGLEIYRIHFPKDHSGVAWILCHLGITHMELENYEQAKELLEKSLTIYQKQFHEKHEWVSWVLTQLGIVYSKMGNYKKGIHLLETNLRDFRKIYGQDHIKIARVLMSLGTVYLHKDDLKKSETFFLQALEIFHKNNHPEKHITLENLAEIYVKKSLYEQNQADLQKAKDLKSKAINHFEQALKIIKASVPEDAPVLKKTEERLINTKNSLENLFQN